MDQWQIDLDKIAALVGLLLENSEHGNPKETALSLIKTLKHEAEGCMTDAEVELIQQENSELQTDLLMMEERVCELER